MYWPTTLSGFNNVARLMDEFNRLWGENTSTAYPKLNAYSNEDGMMLTMELPGVDPKDLDIAVQDNKLTIKGELPGRQQGESVSYHRSERRSGAFSRELTLPFHVNPDAVQAESRHGILAIHLPKPEEEKPRQISVKVA